MELQRKLLCWLLVVLVVAACADEPTPTPDLAATQAAARPLPAETQAAGTPAATPTARPTLPPSPTATQASTATATLTPTATRTPTRVPTAVPTGTPAPTHSPTPTTPPTLTATPTPLPPTRRPAATATPKPTATPLLRYPAPTLLLPVPEATLIEQGHFTWQWEGPPLGEDLFFDLRIWSEREEKAGSEPRGAVELTKGTAVDVLLEFVPAMEFGEGLYYWTVVVVRQADPPQIVGEWGEKRWFKYYLPTPTPTPTPKPARTPSAG